MKLLLLQDQVYLPSLGGGNKANRLLMEALALRGHRCTVIAQALTTRAGPTCESEFLAEMRNREVEVSRPSPGLFAFCHRGCRVEALALESGCERTRYLERRIRELDPDWILVSDDKRRELLAPASTQSLGHARLGRARLGPARPGRGRSNRAVLLLQTLAHLPFGPLASRPCPRQTRLFLAARAVVVISRYLQSYVETHGGVESRLLPLPVYGQGPFPLYGRFEGGRITMINPCAEKGLAIFLALARAFPRLPFAAVPTWGADRAVHAALDAVPNVEVLEPKDSIDEVLARSRVLLAPSLWPETFGYVVVEAMLRGIPVLASDVGGLPEAKLGVDYVLPVAQAEPAAQGYRYPEQDIGPWAKALGELLSDARIYERVSRQSRQAAAQYVAGVSVEAFEELLLTLDDDGLAGGETR